MQSSREWDRIETEFELHGECKSVIHIYKLCNYHTAPSGGDLRLARGTLTSTSYTSGRLEIYLSGQWGAHFSAEGNPCHFVFNLNYYH